MRGVLLAALIIAAVTAQQGAYEAELRRRQIEYAQQQALRQQQAQQQAGGQQYQQQLQAQQQQQYQQQLRAKQQQQALQQMRAQQQQQEYQKRMLQEQIMMEAAMRARAEAGGGLTKSGGLGHQAMSKKDQKKLRKQQDELLKKQKAAAAKATKANAAKRQQAFSAAQRQASKRGGVGAMRAKRTDGSNPLAAVFSIKGALALGGIGYLWVAQREVLLKALGLVLKYPIMVLSFVASKAWALLLKPVLRKIILLRGSSGAVGAAGGELPGGAY